MQELIIENEEAMTKLGEGLAKLLLPGGVIFLQGHVGVGKTTLTRAILRALGYHGKVKSPTYTLVESYSLPTGNIHHFDLYRLQDPMELELIGFRDYFQAKNTVLIEWPEKAEGHLPLPDMIIDIKVLSENKRIIKFTVDGDLQAHLKNLIN